MYSAYLDRFETKLLDENIDSTEKKEVKQTVSMLDKFCIEEKNDSSFKFIY